MGRQRKPKVAIGQAGGPTAVLNSSLYSFIDKAYQDYEVYGIKHGFQGLVNKQFVKFDNKLLKQLEKSRDVPGAFLGSGRYPMNEKDMYQSIQNLKEQQIHALVFIGGNGTMWTCRQLEMIAQKMNYDLSVIGIPKTVDNDLHETDHSPGFGSAARYVALSVRDIGKDLQAMQNFESVRIIETMGRNVGWLTAASMYLKETEVQPPHFIYVPERPFILKNFLHDISETMKSIGHATVVVSEGIRDEKGELISQLSLTVDKHNTVLGGAAAFLAKTVSKELNLASRPELLGMNQRCSQLYVSPQDRIEAEALAKEAAHFLRKGSSGIMVTIIRESLQTDKYMFKIGCTDLAKVAGLERPLPTHFLDEKGTKITNEYRNWLRDIVGSDIKGYPKGLTELVLEK
nr:diphosphate--fructose-6-phosphate 1-phosphotransferase [Paenibacillus bovis]